MGKCVVSISNKMQRHAVYLHLETALHVSSGVRHPQHTQTVSNSSTIAAESSNGAVDTVECTPDDGWK
jgi:hypothetical protein